MKKLIHNGKIVKATISYSNNKYVTERTVYTDDHGVQYVKVNGNFVDLDYYKNNPDYAFHGYWER